MWGLSWLANFDNFFIQALVYHANYDNKIFRRIATVADEPGLVLADGSLLGETDRTGSRFYANGKNFNANGVELETNYQLDNSSVFFNYTYVDGDDGDDGDRIDEHYNFKYPAKHKLVGGVNYSQANWSLSLLGTWTSKMQTVGPDISSQTKWDLTWQYQQPFNDSKLKHTFAVKNLTDKQTLTPDYVDRNPNFTSMNLDLQRRVSYTLSVGF